MNELIVAEKITDWQRLKALVLDSVSSPITRRVYNMALDEFLAWFRQEQRPGLTKATVSAWRVALEARGLGPVSINVRITAVRKLAVEAADNGLLAPELASGIARVKGVEIDWHPRGELVDDPASSDAAEHAGCDDEEGPARPRHPRRPAGLRPAAVRSGGAHVQSHSAARWPVVHRGPGRQTRPRPHGADADVG